ncbi:MAG: transporter ATP-binding protein [Nocardioidaceae bacterium]|nr:transporter ATP-binding protein [Nocardioidaceae bacterium]
MAELGVHGVGVRFGGLVALEDVSFDVPERSVVGVIGPNGAGKTTLFNVVSGFVRPTSGSLVWDGHPFHPAPDRLARTGISRTLQAVGLFAHMTALENVMVGAAGLRRTGFVSALLALPRTDRDERRLREESLRLMERLDVADVADRLPATLPYPVQKRVALARALVCRPRLLMLDEPAGGLGAEDFAPLADLIRGLPQGDEPCSVLLVEHHMDLVMEVCDRVVVLDFGRLVAAGTPDEVRSDPKVAAAYLGTDVPPEAGPVQLAGADGPS